MTGCWQIRPAKTTKTILTSVPSTRLRSELGSVSSWQRHKEFNWPGKKNPNNLQKQQQKEIFCLIATGLLKCEVIWIVRVTKNHQKNHHQSQHSDILNAKENTGVGAEGESSVTLSCLIFLMEKLLQMGSSAYVINFIILASCQLSIKPWFLWFQLQPVKLMWALTETDKRTFFSQINSKWLF